jgi:hypothetical protein
MVDGHCQQLGLGAGQQPVQRLNTPAPSLFRIIIQPSRVVNVVNVVNVVRVGIPSSLVNIAQVWQIKADGGWVHHHRAKALSEGIVLVVSQEDSL